MPAAMDDAFGIAVPRPDLVLIAAGLLIHSDIKAMHLETCFKGVK
jgi:hypothetical protein